MRVVMYSFLQKASSSVRTAVNNRPLQFVLLLVCALYFPVIGVRTLRFAGDEKSYLMQIIEMQDRSAWFVQTLHGEPNYYKGPLHYLMVRAAATVFGTSFWSALFPNFLLMLAGSLALTRTVLRFHPARKRWAVFAGLAFATSTGLYAHALASQMEAQLAGLFAVGAAALAWNRSLLFWVIAGIAGCSKSPLHSVLLGSAGLLYWWADGSLRARLKSPREWLSVVTGIAVCAGGYAPAFFLDRENFIQFFIRREMMDKPGNASPWWVPILPVLTYSIAPWCLLLWAAIPRIFSDLRARARLSRLTLLGASLCIPSFAFFLYHPYRVHTYLLPVIGGLLLIAIGPVCGEKNAGSRGTRVALAGAAGILALLSFSAVAAIRRLGVPFVPGWAMVVMVSCGLAAAAVVPLAWRDRSAAAERGALLTGLAATWTLIGFGALLRVFGVWEVQRLQEIAADTPAKIFYVNSRRSAWSEWGLMAFATGLPVRAVHSEEEAARQLERGSLLVFSDDAEKRSVLSLTNAPGERLRADIWARWQRPAAPLDGRPVWRRAFEQGDWRLLLRNFTVVRLLPPVR